MRRTLLTALIPLGLMAAEPALAQQGRPNPPSGGGIQPLAGNDTQAPVINFTAPGGGNTVYTEYPYIEFQMCDNRTLNQASFWVRVNGVIKTSSFSYVPGEGVDCPFDVNALAATTTVALNIGSNSIQARICDNAGNCTSPSWTVYRVQQGPPTIALRNHNADNRDRGLCLTIGAGQAAGLACGDLFVAHSMPAYRTMGRDRALTLLYTSHTAAPRPAVAVWVTQSTSNQTPNSTFAQLTVNGGVRASATYYAVASGTTKQIVLAFDASDLATGVYPFSLLVRNQYSDSTYDASVNGELIVVNRSASEFGAGWWMAGLEQLVRVSTNRLLWVAGDGSAAIYDSISPGRWVRAAGAFRDTIADSGTVLVRRLRHGVRVRFTDDLSPRHIATVNRTEHSTTFTWTGSPSRLTSIQVPPGVSGTTYTLTWDAGTGPLDAITDPASRVLNATVTSGSLTELRDPDNVPVTFAYDAARRMIRRYSRRGHGTEYTYANGVHVTRVAVPILSATADSARDSLAWWDERGLAMGSPGGTLTTADTASSYTRVNGPRVNVADSARFWVDRWGAPVAIIGTAADTTYVARSLSTGLVSRYRDPAGSIYGMTYDARGNLLTVSDSTHEGHGTGGFEVATTRYTYRDGDAPDSPDSIIDPTGVLTRLSYNASGLPDLAIAPTGQQTQFAYYSGSLAGLPSTVTDLQVPTYSDTISWGASAPLANQAVQFFYNALGNLDSTKTPMGARTSYGYNAFAQVIRTINAVGDTTVYRPRVMGMVDTVEQIGAGGVVRRYRATFDADFNRLSFVDPRDVIRQWAYDAAGRDTAETDDYSYRERRFYGPSGLLDSVRTRNSHTIRRNYDAAGRLTMLRFPAVTGGDTALGDSATYVYDAAGRLTLATNRHGSVTRSYYREGTARSETQSAPSTGVQLTLEYRYDRADRRTWYRDFTGSANDTLLRTYHFAANALLDTLVIDYPGSSPANDTAFFTWDGLGRRSQLVTPHRATTRWLYDLDGRVRRVYSTHAGGANDSARVDKRFRSVDMAGRPLYVTQEVGQYVTVDSFAYDPFGQLRLHKRDGLRTDYTFDLSGNLITAVPAGGGGYDLNVFVPGHNRLQWDSVIDGATRFLNHGYLYSFAGEQLQTIPTSYNPQAQRDFWYDATGRLTSVGSFSPPVSDTIDANIKVMCFKAFCFWYRLSETIVTNSIYVLNRDVCRYDALGRRIKPCGAYEIAFDGNNVVKVYTTRFVHGPGLDDPLVAYTPGAGAGSPVLEYFMTDGASRLLSYTDSVGSDRRGFSDNGVGFTYRYRAVHAGAVANGHTFGASSGKSWGAGDLSFWRNRYYDQRTGRWLTEDPIGVAGGANLYAFVGNNPATFTDPFGLCPDNLDKEPCLPGTVVWKNTGPLEAGTASNAALNNFVASYARALEVTVVIKSADRAGNPEGSANSSEHRTDLGGRGALDLHVYKSDGSMVPDAQASRWMAGYRDAGHDPVRIIRHLPGTCTGGPHIHVDSRTDKGDKREAACQYVPTSDFN